MKGREQGKYSLEHGMSWCAVAVILVATQLVACGSVLDSLPGAGKSGSKSGSSSLTPTQSVGTLSGVAKDALIRNATVNVYAWNGAKGELLGSGKTDNSGSYSLTLQVRSQSVLLEVTGGEYEEEVTGKDISLVTDQALYAVQNYTSGQSLSTAITYYTTLATGLAENLVRLGMKPSDAIEEASARLRNVIGLDTRSVRPTDILNPDSTSVSELEYGFATAALSSLTERASLLNDSEPHRVFTSVRFIQAAYDDVRADGVLNGRGISGDVVFGRIRLTPQIYRHELALHILRIANNKAANRTGRGPKEMFDLAKRLNDSTDPVFGGAPVIPIDGDKPNVSSLVVQEFPNLSNNAVIFGRLSFNAMVVAFPGAARAELLLDGTVVGTAADPENPLITFDTIGGRIGDGRHTLQLRVTDISGAIGESPLLEANVSNQQTMIANISFDGVLLEGGLIGLSSQRPFVTADIIDPALPQTIRYSVKPRMAGTFSPLATISADLGATMLQSGAIVDLRQVMLPDGDATFKVEVTNSVGQLFAKEVPFTIDFTSPLVSIPTPIVLDASNPNDLQGQYFDTESNAICRPLEPADPGDSCLLHVRKAFRIVPQVSDNQSLESVTLTVDGRSGGPPLDSTGFFTVDPMAFMPPPRGMRDGPKSVMVTAADKATNTSSDSRQIVFDTTAPTLASALALTPVAGENVGFIVDGDPVAVKGALDITVQVQDNLGFSSAALLLDGVPIESEQVNQGTTVTLSAKGFATVDRPDGRYTLSVMAADRAGNQLASGAFNPVIRIESDNTAPVLTVDTFRFVRDRESDRRLFLCTMGGVVADDRLQSLRYSTSSGFSTDVLLGSDGTFTIDLEERRSADFTLEAKDVLGNATVLTGRFEFPVNTSNSGMTFSITSTCTIFIEGRRVFQRGL